MRKILIAVFVGLFLTTSLQSPASAFTVNKKCRDAQNLAKNVPEKSIMQDLMDWTSGKITEAQYNQIKKQAKKNQAAEVLQIILDNKQCFSASEINKARNSAK